MESEFPCRSEVGSSEWLDLWSQHKCYLHLDYDCLRCVSGIVLALNRAKYFRPESPLFQCSHGRRVKKSASRALLDIDPQYRTGSNSYNYQKIAVSCDMLSSSFEWILGLRRERCLCRGFFGRQTDYMLSASDDAFAPECLNRSFVRSV